MITEVMSLSTACGNSASDGFYGCVTTTRRTGLKTLALKCDHAFNTDHAPFFLQSTMTFTTAIPTAYRLYARPSRAPVLIVAIAAALLALSAQAQPVQPASAAVAIAPKYSARELEQAFNFMDANHDGAVSRNEAAGFRGVAKYFDRADSNKDEMLSREEFDNAMNGVKPSSNQ